MALEQLDTYRHIKLQNFLKTQEKFFAKTNKVNLLKIKNLLCKTPYEEHGKTNCRPDEKSANHISDKGVSSI